MPRLRALLLNAAVFLLAFNAVAAAQDYRPAAGPACHSSENSGLSRCVQINPHIDSRTLPSFPAGDIGWSLEVALQVFNRQGLWSPT